VAISVLDARSTFAPPRIELGGRLRDVVASRSAVRTTQPSGSRRLPMTVLAAGTIGVIEALALLAVGLTSLDGLMSASIRPHGGVVALSLVVLAGWVVASAGSGATMIDGAGRRSYVTVAYAELVAVAVAGVIAVVVPLPVPTTAHLPLPALVLLVTAVPVTKLLLAASLSAQTWIAAGPRIREHRLDPVAKHRMVVTLTLAVIGLGLGAVAIGGPQPEGPGGFGTSITSVVADR
jgi:hypothetical protein